MDIKVLGTGCANCKSTIALIEQVARDKGVRVTLGKVEELREIMGYGVMSTPGVVIDGKVVHAGGVPSREKIGRWLSPDDRAVNAGMESCCGGAAPTAATGCCGGAGARPAASACCGTAQPEAAPGCGCGRAADGAACC